MKALRGIVVMLGLSALSVALGPVVRGRVAELRAQVGGGGSCGSWTWTKAYISSQGFIACQDVGDACKVCLNEQ